MDVIMYKCTAITRVLLVSREHIPHMQWAYVFFLLPWQLVYYTGRAAHSRERGSGNSRDRQLTSRSLASTLTPQ